MGSVILDRGKSPSTWCAEFAARGIHISERTLRQKARQFGAYYQAGRVMLITPEQIDRIMEEATCRSNRTNVVRHGGPKGALSTTAGRSRNTYGKALEHLQKLGRGTGSGSAKTAK